MEGFQYVVERKKPQEICFGSKMHRDTNPIGKGLSPFEKRYTKELYSKISPQTYMIGHLTSGVARLTNKVRSKRGVGGLASNTPRWDYRIPTHHLSPTRYDPEPFIRRIRPGKVPFNSKSLRKPPALFSTPGVGTYSTSIKCCRKIICPYNFGKPALKSAVEVICSPTLPNKCEKCTVGCQNDYWQKNYTTYLCHACMEEERILHEMYSEKQLKDYKKIRICSFVHSHEGANASIKLMSGKNLKKMERLENYLSLFIK